MSAVPINKVTIPHTNAGYNLTDSADFSTLVTGSGNGVSFAWSGGDVVVLKNDSGSSATYTIKFGPFASITGVGGAVTNPTIVIANNKTYMVRLDSQFADANGNVTIECSVAGKALVVTP